jgi:hypothetical protein
VVAEFMNKSGSSASWAIVNSYKNNSVLNANDWRVLHFWLLIQLSAGLANAGMVQPLAVGVAQKRRCKPF